MVIFASVAPLAGHARRPLIAHDSVDRVTSCAIGQSTAMDDKSGVGYRLRSMICRHEFQYSCKDQRISVYLFSRSLLDTAATRRKTNTTYGRLVRPRRSVLGGKIGHARWCAIVRYEKLLSDWHRPLSLRVDCLCLLGYRSKTTARNILAHSLTARARWEVRQVDVGLAVKITQRGATTERCQRIAFNMLCKRFGEDILFLRFAPLCPLRFPRVPGESSIFGTQTNPTI